MAGKIRIKNWDRWQTYRRDRCQPPWIKVHRCLMANFDWLTLTDEQKGQLVSMWIQAAEKDGVLPGDPEEVRMVCRLQNTPDLMLFRDKGFVDFDAKVASSWRQGGVTVASGWRHSDASEAEAEAEAEEKETLCRVPAEPRPDVAEVIAYLNEKAGTRFRAGAKATVNLVKARLDSGVSLEDVKRVIDDRCAAWLGDPKMRMYLRPETLFGATKFEGYLGGLPAGTSESWADRMAREIAERGSK